MKVLTNEVKENRILGIFFLELFSDSFFSQKTETLPRRVSVFSYMFVMIWFFFLVFQLTLQVQSLNHYVPNIDVYHTYSIYIVACLVWALPIFFLIHWKRWLNNENLILPNKICKNFLISNASLILALDHQKQRVIREYYNIYGPWCKGCPSWVTILQLHTSQKFQIYSQGIWIVHKSNEKCSFSFVDGKLSLNISNFAVEIKEHQGENFWQN